MPTQGLAASLDGVQNIAKVRDCADEAPGNVGHVVEEAADAALVLLSCTCTMIRCQQVAAQPFQHSMLSKPVFSMQHRGGCMSGSV